MVFRTLTYGAAAVAMAAAVACAHPATASAEPGGCVKGGAAGAVAGAAVDHGKTGAAAGCAAGMERRHKYRKHQAAARDAGNPNGTGVANGRTGGQPMPSEPLPAQPQAEPTPSQ